MFDPFKYFGTFSSIDNLVDEIIDPNSDGTIGEHFVHPHWVDDYVKDDGTFIHGFWRDGDGDTSHDLDVEHGGGYFAHDPT